MIKPLSLLLLGGLVALSLHTYAASNKHPNYVPTGPYQKTCQDWGVVDNGYDDFVAAGCKANDGSLWTTHYIAYPELAPDGWQNINGNLFGAGDMPSGPWLITCSGSTYDTLGTYLELKATCLAKDGTKVTSTLLINPDEQAYSDDQGYLHCYSSDHCGGHQKIGTKK
eukprot:m.27187 g.27187  ORF g.27187 m.27187 type:complete len:168 (+) comp7872_c0_seq1:128-631(+)